MTSRASTEYRYEKLTWPEINDAIDLGKVCIVPCGAVEQHGPHLPLDVDLVCPGGIAKGAGMAIPDKLLVLPIVASVPPVRTTAKSPLPLRLKPAAQASDPADPVLETVSFATSRSTTAT